MSVSVLEFIESLEHGPALTTLVTEGINPAIQISMQRTRNCSFCDVQMDTHYGAARTTKTGGRWSGSEIIDSKKSNRAWVNSQSQMCCPQCKEAREILFVLDEERYAAQDWRRTAYATEVSQEAIIAFQEERRSEVQRVTTEARAARAEQKAKATAEAAYREEQRVIEAKKVTEARIDAVCRILDVPFMDDSSINDPRAKTRYAFAIAHTMSLMVDAMDDDALECFLSAWNEAMDDSDRWQRHIPEEARA